MSKIRTLVTFQSKSFNTTISKDYFHHENNYGDDLIKWLIEKFTSHHIDTMSEIGQESYAWYLTCKLNNTDYRFIIGFRPAEEKQPAIWIGWLEKKTGLLGAIFGNHKKNISSEAVLKINEVLSSLPEINNIRWHYQNEFDIGQEDNGQANPIAA